MKEVIANDLGRILSYPLKDTGAFRKFVERRIIFIYGRIVRSMQHEYHHLILEPSNLW
jgi:hypothetical protein